MRLLLDTHVLLWMLHSPGQLGRATTALLRSSHNHLALSTASVWEIAIKVSNGRLKMQQPITALPAVIARMGVDLLEVNVGHALRIADLPHHHRDPFDRMLVAQSEAEGFSLVTADYHFKKYDIPLQWALD